MSESIVGLPFNPGWIDNFPTVNVLRFGHSEVKPEQWHSHSSFHGL